MSLFSKVLYPLGNWPWLRINPQSSLFVIYCLILTAWQWLMIFTCIPVQIEPNKNPLRKRLLALVLWEVGHLSSPSRSCLGTLILIRGGRGVGPAGGAPPTWGGSQITWMLMGEWKMVGFFPGVEMWDDQVNGISKTLPNSSNPFLLFMFWKLSTFLCLF